MNCFIRVLHVLALAVACRVADLHVTDEGRVERKNFQDY